MQIEFEIDGMRLTRTSDAYLIEGSKNFVECVFSFSSDWNELDKWALFKRNNNTYEIFIENNKCLVPIQCTSAEGEFTISVVGRKNAESVTGTASDKLLTVRGSEFVGGMGEEGRLTETYLVEVLAEVKALHEKTAASEINAAQSAQEAADSAAAALQSEKNAKASEKAAEISKEAAAQSETNSKTSEDAARGYADNAELSAQQVTELAEQVNRDAMQVVSDKKSVTELTGQAVKAAGNAQTYMDNTKNYSENVNVFTPSVSTSGVLSWTNKAGLANPPSVNIKGEKGDQGLQGIQGVQGVKGDTGAKGDRGATGSAATIRIGTVTTGEPGTEASVTNSGTVSDAVFNFTIPRGEKGEKGEGGGSGGTSVTVDTTLSATSTNPIANKTVYNALDNKLDKTAAVYEATKATQDGYGNVITSTYARKVDLASYVKTVNNTAPDASGNVNIAVSGSGGVSTSESNTWTAQQNFRDLMLNREKYTTYVVNGTSDTPVTSTMVYAVTGAFTLNLATLAGALSASQSSVFTAYFAANADYSLTISNAGKLKYVGSASDVAITSAGMLLNILMTKDASGNLTSIVQASKLS